MPNSTSATVCSDPLAEAQELWRQYKADDRVRTSRADIHELLRAKDVVESAERRAIDDNPEEDFGLIRVVQRPSGSYAIRVWCPYCRRPHVTECSEGELPVLLGNGRYWRPPPCTPPDKQWRVRLVARPTTHQRLRQFGIKVHAHDQLYHWRADTTLME